MVVLTRNERKQHEQTVILRSIISRSDMSSGSAYSFELTVLGSSGGPLNHSTQCFLLKRAGSRTDGYICVDAGSGLAEIANMLYAEEYGKSFLVKSFYKNGTEDVSRFLAKAIRCTVGFGTLRGELEKEKESTDDNTMTRAFNIFSDIKEYYITHAHLDHLLGLVLNSPVVYDKRGSLKMIYGTSHTIDAIRQHIFNDKVWPNLTINGAIRLNIVEPKVSMGSEAVTDFDCIPFVMNHGLSVEHRTPFMSTAYLFKDRRSGDHILICGDSESDKISGSDSLLTIWKYLAENVPIEKLKAIVIECSNVDEVQDSHLYGHMSPRNIIWELERLKKVYGDDRFIDLQVILSHVKDIIADEDPRITILRQVREQGTKHELGNIGFSIAVKGFTIIL